VGIIGGVDGDLVEQTFTEVATYVRVATEWGRAAALRTTLCLRSQTPDRTPHPPKANAGREQVV